MSVTGKAKPSLKPSGKASVSSRKRAVDIFDDEASQIDQPRTALSAGGGAVASDNQHTETHVSEIVGRGIRVLGETAIAPGSSQILDGNIASGALHFGAGLVAKSLLGPVGWLLVAANSYSKSVNGKGLVELVTEGRANRS